jgi:phospholipid/cholesterol/gamma-HCH transport system substrate-binding protein
VQRAVAELPGVLAKTRASFGATTPFARELGPTFNSLRPFARRLPELNSSLTQLSRSATPTIRNRIRPLVRSARPVVSPLRGAANEFSKATPRLKVTTHELNRLFNTAAYNPQGANAPGAAGRDEGYLYWLGWASHIGALTFNTQDAHGPEWRVYLTVSCGNLVGILNQSPLAPLITGFNQLLGTVCPP